MFGHTKREALGQPADHVDAGTVPRGARRRHHAPRRRWNTPQLIGTTIELVGLTKTGDEFPIELSLASWRAKEGDVLQRDHSKYYPAQTSRRVRRPAEPPERLDSRQRRRRHLRTRPPRMRHLHQCHRGANARMECRRIDRQALGPAPLSDRQRPTALHLRPFLSLRRASRRRHSPHPERFLSSERTASLFPVHYVTSPIREQDRLVGVVVVFQDITARKRQESLQQAQLSVSHILAQAGTIEEAIPQLLRVAGEMGPWDMALFWQSEPTSDRLACQGAWVRPFTSGTSFVTVCRNSEFPPGMDFPGHRLEHKTPALDSGRLGGPPVHPRADRLAPGNTRGLHHSHPNRQRHPWSAGIVFRRHPPPDQPLDSDPGRHGHEDRTIHRPRACRTGLARDT